MAEPKQDQKHSYRNTLNLPQTTFSMKADLVRNEPATLKKWNEQQLYQQIRKARAGADQFSFHDGPPYANGSIHLGHLLNKVLKDLVVRSRTMSGRDVPYVPGWDCHGLPIEHKVMQELGPKAASMQPSQIRELCKAYAEKYVKLQASQMQRLLTLADYDNPYLTMAPAYEAGVLEVFAELVGKGLVYRDLKPVHWSIANRTALAEAELEYYDREDTSVYVLFAIRDGSRLPAGLNAPAGAEADLMIWTTTPWTLPANLAVAVAPQIEYGLFEFYHAGRTRLAVVATALAEQVFKLAGVTVVKQLGACSGQELEEAAITYQHPFRDLAGPVVTASYVTLEDGTGLVHTAPGHGKEDYDTGKRYGLEIYCPVRADGTFDATAPDWLQGVHVWKANDLVVDQLTRNRLLLHAHKFTHSYPHDWRGKTPVIFRATEQWFVGVDRPFDMGEGKETLRHIALQAAERDIEFYPEWGRNRLRGMLETRPDWCLSRQRAWGLPIPAFFDVEGRPLLTRASVLAVAAKVRQLGSDSWFKLSAQDLLADYDAAGDPDAPEWIKSGRVGAEDLQKSSDIFDVWFESGSSWHAAMRQRFGAGCYPMDLYLEGSDQHRGWFQLSLLPALGVTGHAPFEALLTHGFLVDKEGEKFSKSAGNAIEVDTILKEFGADVCRWWVCSVNTDNDVKADMEFFRLAGEEYRKVRNTIRFILGNLYDFDLAKDSHEFTADDASSIDAWALNQLMELVDEVRQSFENYEFRRVHDAIYNFCNETLSAIYLAAIKDRLYCDAADAPRRRRTQTALYRIAESLIRLIAPMLPHTAEEAWTALHRGQADASVHLQLFPEPVEVPTEEDWPHVMMGRDAALKKIEQMRSTQGIDNPLDVGLRLTFTGAAAAYFMKFKKVDFADLCGVSRVEIVHLDEDSEHEAAGEAIEDFISVIDLRDEPRCMRSWKRDGTVSQRSDGGMLTDRDAQALKLA